MNFLVIFIYRTNLKYENKDNLENPFYRRIDKIVRSAIEKSLLVWSAREQKYDIFNFYNNFFLKFPES